MVVMQKTIISFDAKTECETALNFAVLNPDWEREVTTTSITFVKSEISACAFDENKEE